MPKILDKCVKEVQEKIDAGELPKGSSAWAICIDRLKKSKKIKRGKKKTWVTAKDRAEEIKRQLEV